MEIHTENFTKKNQDLEARIRQFEQHNQQLEQNLEEAEEALRAIRRGEVDALVIYGENSEQVYTLEGADHTYRVMVEAIYEGAATLDPGGVILYANRRLAELLGVPLENLLGASLDPYLRPADLASYDAVLRKCQDGFHRSEVTFRHSDGKTFPAQLSASSLMIKDSQSICLIVTDLTEQKVNQAILKSEQMARSILEQAAEGIVVCDRNGKIIRCSQTAIDLIGCNPLFQAFEEMYPLSNTENGSIEPPFSIKEILSGAAFQGIETRLKTPAVDGNSQGKYYWVLASANPLRNDQDQIQGAIVMLTDITDRRKAEQAYRQSEEKAREDRVHIEVQRKLSDQREQERQQIARDLHDGPVQGLMANMFLLHQLVQDSSLTERAGLQAVYQSLQELAGDLRTFSSELRPPLLIQFGLEKAIYSHLGKLREKYPAIAFHFSHTHIDHPLPENLTLTLYRIYQESMNNILRHSRASRVEILYRKAPHQIDLEIRDNGIGFTPTDDWLEPMQSGHLGLVGIRERAEAAGGKLEILSQPGQGTVLITTIAINPG